MGEHRGGLRSLPAGEAVTATAPPPLRSIDAETAPHLERSGRTSSVAVRLRGAAPANG